MPGANNTEDGALYEIACQSGAMAIAAGGTQAGGLVSEEDILFAIACNFRNTIIGLGDTPCAVGYVDQATTWQAILLYSIQLTGLTGAATAFGSMVQPLGGILCNLIQVGENTGQAPAGIGTGTYLNTLNSIACALAQIVENGFSPVTPPLAPENLVATPGDTVVDLTWDASATATSYAVFRGTSNGGPYSPIASGLLVTNYHDTGRTNGVTYYYVVKAGNAGGASPNSNQASATPAGDPVQAFIDAINAFAPDVLLVADRGILVSPVVLWSDSSGNAANATPTGTLATAPTLSVGSLNGKNTVVFNGAANQLQGPYINSGATMTGIVVYKRTGGDGAGRVITTATVQGGGDITDGAPAVVYHDAGAQAASCFSGGPLSNASAPNNTFILAASWFDGANSHMQTIAQTGAPVAHSANLASILYSIGATSGVASPLTGEIAFCAYWKSNQGPNIASIMATIQAYYGL